MVAGRRADGALETMLNKIATSKDEVDEATANLLALLERS